MLLRRVDQVAVTTKCHQRIAQLMRPSVHDDLVMEYSHQNIVVS